MKLYRQKLKISISNASWFESSNFESANLPVLSHMSNSRQVSPSPWAPSECPHGQGYKKMGESKTAEYGKSAGNSTREQGWAVQGCTSSCTQRHLCFSFAYQDLWLLLTNPFLCAPSFYFNACCVPTSRKVSFHVILLQWTRAKPLFS